MLGDVDNPVHVRMFVQRHKKGIVSVLLTGAYIVWMMRETNPAALRQVQMVASLRLKRFADVQARAWESVASAAATSYHKARW